MNPVQSAFLGALQGVTEWLPISSQGQTVLAMLNLMRIDAGTALSLAVFLHTGTMLAVIIRFRNEFISMLNPESKLLRAIVVATGSTAITGVPVLLLTMSYIQDIQCRHLFGGEGDITTTTALTGVIGVMLIVTGIILGLGRHNRRRIGTGNSSSNSSSVLRSLDEIRTRDMIIAGLAQGFAIIPGISRSGVTITALLMCGIKQELALELSFLMSVPAVLGAVLVFEIRSASVAASAIPVTSAVIMMLSSLVVGYITMDILLRFAKRVNFAIFCITLGALTLLFSQHSFFSFHLLLLI